MGNDKNINRTVVLVAFDGDGAELERQHIRGRYAPELSYLEFEYAARARKAVKIVMEVTFSLLLCFFLSHSAEARVDHKHRIGMFELRDNNPFSGARGIVVSLERVPSWPEEGTEAVSYSGLDMTTALSFEMQRLRQTAYDALKVPSKLNDNWWSLASPAGQAFILSGLLLCFLSCCAFRDISRGRPKK